MGVKSLKYRGVSASSPPNYKTRTRAPRETDYDGVVVGDFWGERDSDNIWMLTSKSAGVSTWTEITFGGGGIAEIDNLTISTSLTLDFAGEGTLRTDAFGLVEVLDDGVDLDVYMGSTGNPAEWGGIESMGATVTITRTATGINLEAAGGTDADTFLTDDANIVVPTAGSNITITGTANLNTTGAVAHTISINMEDNVTLAGDLQAVNGTFTSLLRGVVQTDGTGFMFSDEGSAGEVLIGSDAGPPAWNAITGGANVTVDNTVDNQITINATGGGAVGQIWTTRSSRPNANREIYDDVAYGGGYWVAVSRGQSLRYSTDLTGNWTKHATAGPSNLLGVTYGNGFFVVVADNGSIRYINGNPAGVWTNVATGSPGFQDIVYGGGFFVAVTNTGHSRYAANPAGPWLLTPGAATSNLYGITYGNGYYIAVGGPGSNLYYTNAPNVAWSVNGVSGQILYGVAFGNNTFVATGAGGNIAYIVGNPTAGWTSALLASGNPGGHFQFNGAAYGNGYFATCGDGGMIMITSDPATPWIVANPGLIPGDTTTVFNFNGMTYGDGTFAAVGGELTSTLVI